MFAKVPEMIIGMIEIQEGVPAWDSNQKNILAEVCGGTKGEQKICTLDGVD
jgi:hypothetical protein